MVAAGLLAFMVLAETDAGAGVAGDPTPAAEAAPVPPSAAPPAAAPLPEWTHQPPPPPPEAPPRVRRYGDRGIIELGLGLTYSSEAGLAAAGSGRYYIVDRVAPGLEATFVSGGEAATRYGLLLAALRVIPLRISSLALALTGRAGRVFIGAHDDGWGAGGGASLLFLFSPTVGIELGYDVLRMFPSSFCDDLESCVIHGPVIAVRFGF